MTSFEAPRGAPTPLREDPNLTAELESIEAAANRLQQIAELYDKNYCELSEVLGLIADASDRTSTHRSRDVSELRDNWRSWIDRAKRVNEECQDTANFKEKQETLRELEIEQTDMVTELIAANQHTSELKNERDSMDRSCTKLDRSIKALAERKESEVPSLEYLLKIIKAITHVKLMPTTDPNLITGIVPHVERREVESFTYNKQKHDVFDRVNEIWDRIE